MFITGAVVDGCLPALQIKIKASQIMFHTPVQDGPLLRQRCAAKK